ncbi:MAG: PAS domain S-box protein [Planctomycetales bacterium]|nr:PAS domain S-box protein [Planctomycetales bacterium]
MSAEQFQLAPRVQTALRDLTEQGAVQHHRQLFADLAESEVRLRAILGSAVDGIVTITDDGTIHSVNHAAEKMFGYELDELLGRNVSMLMPAPYNADHDQHIQEYVRSGVAKVIGIGREVEGLRKDGTTFPIELSLSEVITPSRRLFTGILRDITARKQSEAEHATLGHILENSLNELFFFDAETWRFVFANRGARENTGYSLDELCQRTPLDLKPGMTRQELNSHLSPLIGGARNRVTFESQHQRKDGSTYDVEVHVQLAELRGRAVFVAIILDVTLNRDTQRKLVQLNQELEERVADRTKQLEAAQAELLNNERLAALGRVSGGVAHEIRNPLNAIKTSAYYLLETMPHDEKLREHLERIDRQVEHASGVITALTNFAKMPMPLFAAVSARELIEQTLEQTRVPANIEVDNGVETSHIISVDAVQIRIVLRNLIVNAIDAMAHGGRLSFRSTRTNDRIEIRVADTGTGIAPDRLQRIMEPLFSTKTSGIGLGLAIAQSIVDKNAGQLAVESTIGMGTTFCLTLNAAPPSA